MYIYYLSVLMCRWLFIDHTCSSICRTTLQVKTFYSLLNTLFLSVLTILYFGVTVWVEYVVLRFSPRLADVCVRDEVTVEIILKKVIFNYLHFDSSFRRMSPAVLGFQETF